MPERTLNLSMRPKSFDEVIGNEKAVNAVRGILASGKLPVAFMFVGPYGCGKTTMAKIVAREVQGFDFPVDLEPEVLKVNASDDTKIEDMRALLQASQFRPLVGKYKIIILDEAHRLSKNSQDALLTSWEEVNSATIWIVCTTEDKKILKGLKDRSFKVQMMPATAEDRHKLILRAAETVQPPLSAEKIKEFEDAASAAQLNSPRDILMSFERFIVGMPAQDAVLVERAEPEYFQIVQAACGGNWSQCAKLLAELNLKLDKEKGRTIVEGEEKADETGETKVEAAAALRGITGGFLRSMLVGNPNTKKPAASGPRADAIEKSLLALRNYAWQVNDPAVAFPLTCAALYRISVNLKQN